MMPRLTAMLTVPSFRVDVTRDGDTHRCDVPPQLAPSILDESGDLSDKR